MPIASKAAPPAEARVLGEGSRGLPEILTNPFMPGFAATIVSKLNPGD